MEQAIGDGEAHFGHTTDARLGHALGIALRNYTAWHKRGEERRPYLEKAAFYFGRAAELCLADDSIPVQLDRSSTTHGNVDRVMIYGDLGVILVDAPLVRDLDRAIEALSFVYNNSSDYEPNLCWYADAFFKKGEFEKAAEVGLMLHDRAKNSVLWKAHVPTAPMATVASAYRALGKDARKRGDIERARSYFQKMVEFGVASREDMRILESFKSPE